MLAKMKYKHLTLKFELNDLTTFYYIILSRYQALLQLILNFKNAF